MIPAGPSVITLEMLRLIRRALTETHESQEHLSHDLLPFVVETGEAREVHHCALLIGYGASAVTPRLAFETLDGMIRQGALSKSDHATAVDNYVKALNKGILKVMSKMGISTVQSYCGAQIFEAIGLRQDFVDKYFAGTASRVEGIGRPRVEPSFIPTSVDAMVKVPDALSLAAMRHVSRQLGRRVGGSTGTNFIGVLQAAQWMREAGHQGSIVSILCDSGER